MRKRGKVYIIAEAGVNHNGSLEIAESLVEEAKKSGADAVKFQTFNPAMLASRFAGKAQYQKKTTRRDESQLKMIEKLALTRKDHVALFALCRKKHVDFLSSPFDKSSVDLLENLGVASYKIPSGEITNLPLLEYIAANVIFSAGNKDVTLLHCVTEYPAPYEEINLRAMLTMKNAFNLPVGYSDHTRGIEVSIAAAALGAEAIEKHFTLDRTMEGPDHKASIEPRELKQLVESIRNVEKSLGSGNKRPAACELKNIPVARKSVVAAKRIRGGERITWDCVTIKRPGHGIAPGDLGKIVGLRARITIEADQVISWGDLK